MVTTEGTRGPNRVGITRPRQLKSSTRHPYPGISLARMAGLGRSPPDMIAPSDTGVAAPTPPKSFSPRARRWFLSAALLLLVFGTGAVMTLLIVPSWLSGYAQRELSARTSRHFDGDVSVTSLNVSLFPRVRVDGTGLELRQHGHPSDP